MSIPESIDYPHENRVDFLLNKIKSLQAENSPIYPDGLFPSQRFHTILPYCREDSNVFFTALIVFTLQQLSTKLTDAQNETAENLCAKAIKTYPLYKSRRGLGTYNFWQNTDNKQFPHGFLLNHLKFLELPDDTDDSALIYLTNNPSRQEVKWLKAEMERHANKSKAQIKSTLPKFRDFKAYTTWFGKNMYLEFDFCVLCNVLYFVYHFKLPLNVHDEDSIAYLKAVIESNQHISKPFLVSPSYPRTALILYHFTRLITAFDIPALNTSKEIVKTQIYHLFNSALPQMDKVLLATSMARLSMNPVEMITSLTIDLTNYYFFNGGMLTAFENPIARRLAPHDFFHMKHNCEAYNFTLLLEYEVLREQAS